MTRMELIKRHFKALRLSYALEAVEDILTVSTKKSESYEEFLEKLLKKELDMREEKRISIALHRAKFPLISTFDEINIDEMKSLSKKELNQLKELGWVQRGFNLIFLGPPGVGKTMMSTAIGVHAVQSGYKVFFTTMNSLIRMLKTQDIMRSSQQKINYILKCDLLIIDDLMFMALEKNEANLFFQLINSLYGNTSIIITSNKGPSEWGELINEPAIITAILDRILHKCDIIQLYEESWRMNHRETIFDKKSKVSKGTK